MYHNIYNNYGFYCDSPVREVMRTVRLLASLAFMLVEVPAPPTEPNANATGGEGNGHGVTTTNP